MSFLICVCVKQQDGSGGGAASLYKIGDRVKTVKGDGSVRFVGYTHLDSGIFIGIELDEPNGGHNGTIDNRTYFVGKQNHC